MNFFSSSNSCDQNHNDKENSKKIILINGDLFLGRPAQILKNQYLIISSQDGLIEDFGNMSDCKLSVFSDSEKFKIIDCFGLLISPGLIDVHVHFRDPGFKFKEDIKSGSESAAAGGFTTVVCMPNTSPSLDNLMTADYLKNTITKNSLVNIGFYCAATKNSAGREITPIQSLIQAGAVGFTDDGLPVANAKIMKDLFRYSALHDIVIAQHAEDHNLMNGGCVHKCGFSQRHSLPIADPASEYSVIARDISLLEDPDLHNARYHVLHVSCKESLQYIANAKKKGLKVTSEITPHHFSVTANLLDEQWAMAKMNPPLRGSDDVSAMISAMKDGTIDIIASDHAPHDNDSKEKPISCASFGIIGLETMIGLSFELYHKGLISLERILEMMTINPALLINEKNRGFIGIGAIADITIIDPKKEWFIDSHKMKSKSTNSPFNGRKVIGRNLCTIVSGKIVYSEMVNSFESLVDDKILV